MTAEDSNLDFRVFYELEPYLFDTVSRRFAEEHVLSAIDFFCIVIWKANRAKSKVARRLMASGRYSTLDGAVRALTTAITTAATPKGRLHILIKDWGFRLPDGLRDCDRALSG